MSDQVAIQISDQLIKPIIETKIQAAIVNALGDQGELIEQAVTAALNMKCDEDGQRAKYSSDNKYTFLQALSQKLVREAATAALNQWVEENRPKIQKEFLRQLNQQKSCKKFIDSILDGTAAAIANNWRFQLSVKID